MAAATSTVRELLGEVVEIAGRGFPSEAAAREGLAAFRGSLRETTPIDRVLKRLFGRAAVREVETEGGEKAFKVFLHGAAGEPAEASVAPVIRGLRAGDLDAVARALDLAPAELGSKAFRTGYKAYAREIFPDVRLAEEAAAAERALPSALAAASRDLRPETAEALLTAIRRDDELNRLVTRLAGHIAKNGGTRFRYVSAFLVLSGVAGSVTAVALALHEQARRAAGCWRVYLDPVTKRLRSCKILHASCRNPAANEGAPCDRTPVSFDAATCRGAGPDDECLRCDPTADPTDAKHYMPPSLYLEPNDVYVCRPVASVGEMLGRVVADVPDLAVDAVDGVADTVARAWNSVKYFLLAGGSIVLLILLVVVYVRRPSRNDDDGGGKGGGGGGATGRAEKTAERETVEGRGGRTLTLDGSQLTSRAPPGGVAWYGKPAHAF